MKKENFRIIKKMIEGASVQDYKEYSREFSGHRDCDFDGFKIVLRYDKDPFIKIWKIALDGKTLNLSYLQKIRIKAMVMKKGKCFLDKIKLEKEKNDFEFFNSILENVEKKKENDIANREKHEGMISLSDSDGFLSLVENSKN